MASERTLGACLPLPATGRPHNRFARGKIDVYGKAPYLVVRPAHNGANFLARTQLSASLTVPQSWCGWRSARARQPMTG